MDIISTILPDIQTTESTFASQQQFDNNGRSVSSGICVWSISIPKIQNEKRKMNIPTNPTQYKPTFLGEGQTQTQTLFPQ